MDTTEITRLAEAIHALRPDWPQTSLDTFISREFAAKPMRDIAVALTWVACDPQSQTPRRVCESGPWWQAVAAGTGTEPTRTPPRIQTCEHCGGYLSDTNREQHRNRRCIAEHQAGVYARGAAQARAALAEARHTTTEKETSHG